jgi:hypothetical protein
MNVYRAHIQPGSQGGVIGSADLSVTVDLIVVARTLAGVQRGSMRRPVRIMIMISATPNGHWQWQSALSGQYSVLSGEASSVATALSICKNSLLAMRRGLHLLS